jgi:hypothetical protein
MTCDTGRPELLSWDVGRPAHDRCVPNTRERCGPDVAPAAGPATHPHRFCCRSLGLEGAEDKRSHNDKEQDAAQKDPQGRPPQWPTTAIVFSQVLAVDPRADPSAAQRPSAGREVVAGTGGPWRSPAPPRPLCLRRMCGTVKVG